MFHFSTIDEGSKHYSGKTTEEINKNAVKREKFNIQPKKQIECSNCKTLNKPNCILCISCGVNMLASKQVRMIDYGFLHKARIRRKHQ